jgi:hypothetical protein
MFKFFNFGKGINTQDITNSSDHGVELTITGDRITNGTWNIAAGEKLSIPVHRASIGELHARVRLLYANNHEYVFQFQVTPREETDIVIIENDNVVYNGKQRGKLVKNIARIKVQRLDVENVKLAIRLVYKKDSERMTAICEMLQQLVMISEIDDIKAVARILQIELKTSKRADLIDEVCRVLKHQSFN